MVSTDFIKQEYPLHLLVWHNNYQELEVELIKKVHDKEKRDPRGRTPLMLAVTLGFVESVRLLLNYDANVNCENTDGWTVVQEAVATGDPELLQIVLEKRENQRFSNRMAGIPELLQRLNQAPDFYVEMKWEFTSWVPLVSRMCPSDTYKVYKQGSNVRIDTTLLGFDHTNWQRGNRSYVFKGQTDGATMMMEVDHDTRQVYIERMQIVPNPLVDLNETNDISGATATSFNHPAASDEMLSHRLTSPIVSTYVDTEKISFERNKAGMWGWRSDKSEQVNGHECKVFGATNVELVTKTRSEHLTESDKAKSRTPKTPLQSFLGIAETEQYLQQQQQQQQATSNHDGNTDQNTKSRNPCDITAEEYFDAEVPLKGGRDIGRPKEIHTKVHRFRATLWLAENYPLSLQEQIMPIVDLMAITSTHFAKLKDFIQMQLPSGFPVKIEIPLFHVLNARITFGNIFALDNDVVGVARIQEEQATSPSPRITCIVDDTCFQSPTGYQLLGATDSRRQFSVEDEDDLLQFAIQQSLIEAGTEREEVDIWEALKGQRPSSRPTTPNHQMIGEEERQLQRAIQASLALYQHQQQSQSFDDDDDEQSIMPLPSLPLDKTATEDSPDADLQIALMLSEQQRKQEEETRLQEQKMLEDILQLSLTDK